MGGNARGRRIGGDQVINRPAQFRPGADNRWDSVDASALNSLDRVTGKVVSHAATLTHIPPPQDATASAVLIALFQGAHGVEVVLTRRSQQLRNHRGEISFPGGRIDGDELAVDTALREAEEEIDLARAEVEIIGQLNAAGTIVSNSHIVPIVARLHSKPSLFARNAEVDRVFSVALVDLIRPDTYAEEYWVGPGGEHCIHFFHLDDETIWGVTARMLFQLLSVALDT